MPRLARIDFPGLLHHIMARGINRQSIFTDKKDYADFLNRIDIALEKSPNQIFAWALMPNHFHLLVRSGAKGIVPFMRRLMTGYAGGFNARHERTGHLFENRYKSIVCDEQSYLLELVRYIHLNPLRGGIVKNLEELANFPYSGHGGLLRKRRVPWQNVDEVFRLFSNQESLARQRYLQFVEAGIGQGKREDLIGGGLGRSLGGGPRQIPRESLNDRQLYDPRMLGSGQFVESVLIEVEKTEEVKRSLIRQNLGLSELGQRVAKKYSIDLAWLYIRGRTKKVSEAKSLLIFLGTEYLGKSNVEMAHLVKMTPAAAGRARLRGLILARSIELEDIETWMKVN